MSLLFRRAVRNAGLSEDDRAANRIDPTGPEAIKSQSKDTIIDDSESAPVEPAMQKTGTVSEQVPLYEQPLDRSFPMNFDDSARWSDYHGDKDPLSKQMSLMDDEWWDRIRAIEPPVDGMVCLGTWDPKLGRPKPTRLCFDIIMERGHEERVHEIHALTLRTIREYFPESQFPELYPLIVRYHKNYTVLL